MTIDEAISKIESVEFSAKANLASSTRSFRRGVRSDPAYATLRHALMEDGSDVGHALLARVHSLVEARTEPGYEHPHDTAVATYLVLLDDTASVWAQPAASMSLGIAGGWWAPRITRAIGHRTASEPAPLSLAAAFAPRESEAHIGSAGVVEDLANALVVTVRGGLSSAVARITSAASATAEGPVLDTPQFFQVSYRNDTLDSLVAV